MNSAHQVRHRVIVNSILFFTVLYAPWWLILASLLSSIVWFKNFYEAVFFGFLFDTLYGVNIGNILDFRFFLSVVLLLFILFTDFIKGKVRL